MLEVQLLDTNYRSGQTVVNFVNKSFNSLTNYPYDPQHVKSSKVGLVEVVPFASNEYEIFEEIYLKVDFSKPQLAK